MNKAILVIDMPKKCGDCPLMCWDDEMGEIHPGKWIGCWLNKRETNGKKPKWCPLMPPRYVIPLRLKGEKSDRYAEGWNDCMRAILGEKAILGEEDE